MSLTLYGIQNCDTVKRARAWLEARGVAYDFHDYKKQGVDLPVLRAAIDAHGWEEVINRRGTTWRKLPEERRAGLDANGALTLAQENSSVIKRPLLVTGGQSYLGFSDALYADIFETA